MKNKCTLFFFICFLFLLNVQKVNAQIIAPAAQAAVKTEYTVFQQQDDIFIFCSTDENASLASLQAQTLLVGTKTFLWEKYNPATGAFEFHFSESTDRQQSPVQNLENGGYRVTVTQGATTEIYRAWVFNNWTTATAVISESTCESFLMEGEFTTSPMIYYDIASNNQLELFKDIKAEWRDGEIILSGNLDFRVSNPPSENTEYTLRIFDRFGCEGIANVFYESIVPLAAFTAEPMTGEAPLEVTFNNLSKNADPGSYEWFFYRSLDDIKRESERTQLPIDSIALVAYDQNPIYTYENSGSYKVKLVAKNTSEFHTCVDTAYLQDYIVVDTSFVAVPNVFTPNSDGINDNFIVQFWSMQSIKISIFNRWGKRIHFWENNNVRGFGDTYSATVWDGRSGGRFATPGVYYYIVEGKGRDDKTRKAHGFFHLFRDKD